MPWQPMCSLHGAPWYLDEPYCAEPFEDPYDDVDCIPMVFVAAKQGFDNKFELDLNPLEKEDILRWMMKTKRSAT